MKRGARFERPDQTIDPDRRINDECLLRHPHRRYRRAAD